MNKKDLIYDGKYARHCTSNLAKMNVFEVVALVKAFSYPAMALELANVLKEVGEALIVILAFILHIVLFPIVPFVHAYRAIESAKKEMRRKYNG